MFDNLQTNICAHSVQLMEKAARLRDLSPVRRAVFTTTRLPFDLLDNRSQQ
jgi:hypothetical protein